MSLIQRKWGQRLYYVFKMRKEGKKKSPRELYLGPVSHPDPSRVKEAIRYVEMMKGEYEKRYDELRDRLLKLLPADQGA